MLNWIRKVLRIASPSQRVAAGVMVRSPYTIALKGGKVQHVNADYYEKVNGKFYFYAYFGARIGYFRVCEIDARNVKEVKKQK